ncbi:MAG: DUF6514 family protein [Oscillospiraceae bacterium]|nr:DUF6514 family protein [Oscillospiraceae bacterium]
MNVLANIKPGAKNISSDKIVFELTVSHVDDFEQMSYTTYGIRAICPGGEVAAYYPDISVSKECVQEFIELVSGNDVAAVHIHDLIEDFLS